MFWRQALVAHENNASRPDDLNQQPRCGRKTMFLDLSSIPWQHHCRLSPSGQKDDLAVERLRKTTPWYAEEELLLTGRAGKGNWTSVSTLINRPYPEKVVVLGHPLERIARNVADR